MTKDKAEFYKLNVGAIPDDLYRNETPAEKWLKLAESTTNRKGFPADSLNQLDPIDKDVEMERVIGIALYMAANPLPFVLLSLMILSYFSIVGWYLLGFVILYVGTLYGLEYYYYKPMFLKRYQRADSMTGSFKDNQYLFTERNSAKYFSTTVVWPKSLHPPALKDKPLLFCTVPHAVIPFGMTIYPVWSKLWNSRLCHWTCAPIVLQLPLIGYYMAQLGYVAAKAKNIYETLTKKEENVGVILDGIAGIYQADPQHEIAFLEERKGIVKIALKAGAPIVPVYGFGHTSTYSILLDPFGIVAFLSNRFQVAMVPFFGKNGWFLGPPPRVPLTMCLGDPIECPQIAEPTQADIDKYHALMVHGFRNVFEQHKDAYGWSNKKLKVV